MHEFRVTKYNPENRNAAGEYLLDEWTEFSDVGKRISLEEYERVENAYLQSAADFTGTWRSSFARVTDIQAPKGNGTFAEAEHIAKDDIPALLRSLLRSEFWCKIEADDGFIHVGWDFYMYLGCPEIDEDVIKRTEARGLFVEQFASPYREAD